MNNRRIIPIIIVVIGAVLIIAFSKQIFLTIEAGERGVLFRPFSGGLELDHTYTPGFHIKAPWNSMYIYNVKEQSVEETMNVLDKNGLDIKVDVTVRFNPIYDRIGYLHERFGKNYVTSLVVPEVRSQVRKVMGRYTAEEIYSTKRTQVESEIISETEKLLSNEQNNIKMNALLIRSINLPDKIKQAIEAKLTAEQEALAMEFVKQKETEEAERKRIAAEGEARANNIVNNSLTDKLLKMRGIEATERLSNSQNSKVIIIGSGSDGLPLILGNN